MPTLHQFKVVRFMRLLDAPPDLVESLPEKITQGVGTICGFAANGIGRLKWKCPAVGEK